MFKLNQQKVKKALPIYIAALALIVSLWQGYLTRKQFINAKEHNKLSVKPWLGVSALGFSNNQNIGIIVSNIGIGPAIVDSIGIYYKNKKIPDWEELTSTLLKNKENFFPENNLPKYKWGFPFGINKEKRIGLYWVHDFNDLHHDNYYRFLNSLDVIIYYKSFYNEPDSNKLDLSFKLYF